MLHNYCKGPAPRHVRDFYLARFYRATSTADMNHYSPYDHNNDSIHDPRFLSIQRTRPRGDDGRFVPRGDEEIPVDTRDRKVCGWCRTTSTSQWRVGPTHGSVEMGTLCNACGINYRRALAKSPDGALDLDRLAQQMGHTRLSIQKALKRQRKLSAPPHQFKRSRIPPRNGDRMAARASERYAINSRSSITNSNSSLTMLLSDDSVTSTPPSTLRRPSSMAESAVDSGLYCMATPLAVSRGYGTQNSAPMMHQHGGSLELTVPPAHSLLSQAGLDREGLQSRGEDHSRLPPFQSFIGELERRSPM